MTGLETNIFPITNLAELSSTYRLYLIRGLRQDQAEYHQNRQIIARKLGITRARTNLPLPGPGRRCFLQARRCRLVSAHAQVGLASLDYLLEHGDSSAEYPKRSLRLAGADSELLNFAALWQLKSTSFEPRRPVLAKEPGSQGRELGQGGGPLLVGPDPPTDPRGSHTLWPKRVPVRRTLVFRPRGPYHPGLVPACGPGPSPRGSRPV